MLLRKLGLAAALVFAVPALALAQPSSPPLGSDANPTPHKVGKTTLSGLVTAGANVTVNNVKIESGPFSQLLKPLAGKFVTLKGTIAAGEGMDSMKVTSVRGMNPSTKKPVDILENPDADALAMTSVDPGKGIDVTGQSRDRKWLRVNIEMDGGSTMPGWVRASELQISGDSMPANPKQKVNGIVGVADGAVTVSGIKVTNEPFLGILKGAEGRSVTLEGFVTKGAAGQQIKVTGLTVHNESSRQQVLKIRQGADDKAPQMGAPVASGESIQITGTTPDGLWYTTIVAEGDMRETGFVKVTDVTVGIPVPTPATRPVTTGVNGALQPRQP